MWFSGDVEADGPIPGPYSMSSFGLVVVGTFVDGGLVRAAEPAPGFYAELRPISDDLVPEAAAVSGLDRAALLADGQDPAEAMTAAGRWIREQSGAARPVFVGYPAVYDWLWLYWYFVRFAADGSPFGFSGALDLKTLYAARAGVGIGASTKRQMPRELLSRRPHTHHALDDAREQADLAANLIAWRQSPDG